MILKYGVQGITILFLIALGMHWDWISVGCIVYLFGIQSN
jgi:hypothetical protein